MSLYPTLEMARTVLPPELLKVNNAAMSDEALTTFLTNASEIADGYLSAPVSPGSPSTRYTLPLVSWGDDLRKYVIDLAAYDIGERKGHAPEGTKSLLRVRFDDAIAWLKRIAAGELRPPGIVDSGTPPSPAGGTGGRPIVRTGCARGWGNRRV